MNTMFGRCLLGQGPKHNTGVMLPRANRRNFIVDSKQCLITGETLSHGLYYLSHNAVWDTARLFALYTGLGA